MSEVTVDDKAKNRPVTEAGTKANEYGIPYIANDKEMERDYRRTWWWQGEQQGSTLLRVK